MIKTTIEVQGADSFEFDRNLEAALDKLGFEPKRGADFNIFHADLASVLAEKGLKPSEMVRDFRKSRAASLGEPWFGH